MISIFDASGSRLAIAYNGLTLNNPADAYNNTYEVNGVVETETLASFKEPAANGDGLEAYKVRKVVKLIRIDGTIRAPDLPTLFDKAVALVAAFDGAKVSHENPSTEGYLPLTFSIPTNDTTDYPSGLVASKYYVRALKCVVPTITEYIGNSAFFSLELEAVDPRRYLQAQSSTGALPGSSLVGNPLANYRSLPVMTVTMTGAHTTGFTLGASHANGAPAQSLSLSLSGGAAGTVYTIDMQKQTIVDQNGVDQTASVYLSGTWLEIEPGNNTITVSDLTNCSLSMTWYPAFCA